MNRAAAEVLLRRIDSGCARHRADDPYFSGHVGWIAYCDFVALDTLALLCEAEGAGEDASATVGELIHEIQVDFLTMDTLELFDGSVMTSARESLAQKRKSILSSTVQPKES